MCSYSPTQETLSVSVQLPLTGCMVVVLRLLLRGLMVPNVIRIPAETTLHARTHTQRITLFCGLVLVLEHRWWSRSRVLDEWCRVTLIVGTAIILVLRIRIKVRHRWRVGLLCACGGRLRRLRRRGRDDRRGGLRMLVLVLGGRKTLNIIMS